MLEYCQMIKEILDTFVKNSKYFIDMVNFGDICKILFRYMGTLQNILRDMEHQAGLLYWLIERPTDQKCTGSCAISGRLFYMYKNLMIWMRFAYLFGGLIGLIFVFICTSKLCFAVAKALARLLTCAGSSESCCLTVVKSTIA